MRIFVYKHCPGKAGGPLNSATGKGFGSDSQRQASNGTVAWMKRATHKVCSFEQSRWRQSPAFRRSRNRWRNLGPSFPYCSAPIWRRISQIWEMLRASRSAICSSSRLSSAGMRKASGVSFLAGIADIVRKAHHFDYWCHWHVDLCECNIMYEVLVHDQKTGICPWQTCSR